MNASGNIAGLVGHLALSTVVVLVAWMLTRALRSNRPGVRFWIWFFASIKFLLTFSILVDAGEWLRRITAAPIRESTVAAVLTRIPLASTIATSTAALGVSANGRGSSVLLVMISLIWACGSLILIARWWRRWRRICRVVRRAQPSGIAADVPVLLTSELPEPGVCGIINPVLLLPFSIKEHLSHDQLKAVIAHEVFHVRRRDNLLFAIHMVVETLFWFHPLVWWIGSRLIEEREGACDEAALQAGNDAKVYAQGILNVCKCRLDSSPLMISGIAGADLKNRIIRIAEGHAGKRLGAHKIALLTVAAFLVVAIPAWIGLIGQAEARVESSSQQPSADLPQFEVASIKPGKPSPKGSGVFINGHRFEVIDTKLEMLISFAYGLHPRQIVGAPDWTGKDEFDITGLAEGDTQPTLAQWKLMMQKLLADRFNLRYHRETRDLPVYLLSVVRRGAKLTRSEGDPAALPMVFFPGQWGKLVGRNAGIKDFAAQIQNVVLDRPVLDETGLSGRYDFTLSWTLDESQFTSINERIPPSADPANAPPPLFTAIQEQLGLKLEAGHGRAEVIVIDRLEKRTPN